MIKISTPDGSSFNFPDDTPQDEIQSAMDAHFGSKKSAEQPGVAADVAKSTAIAVPQTAIGLAGLPGTVNDYVGRGVNALGNLVTGKTGSYEDYQKKRAAALSGGPDITAPTTEAVQNKVEGVTGPFYEPKTVGGQVANAATQSALTAMLFPGKLATNALLGAGTGTASEGVGQVADAYVPKLGPAARVGSSVLLGGVGAAFPNAATRRATSAARNTIEDLHAGGSGAYDAVKNMGVTYDPTTISKGLAGIGKSLEDEYGANIPNTLKLLADKEAAHAPGPPHPALDPRPAPAAKAPVDIDELQTLRKQLGRPAANPTEGLAARQAQGQIDDFLASIDPAHVVTGDAKAAAAKLGEARDYWSAMRRSEIASGRLDLSNLNQSGAGTGTNVNAQRQPFKALVRPNMKGEIPAEKFGFNEAEIAQANKVARGEWIDNLLRHIGGGVGHSVAGGYGLYDYIKTGDPTVLGLYAASGGAKRLSGALTKSKARVFDEMVRSRSPAGAFKYDVTPPPGRLGTGTTGTLLGLDQLRRQLLDNQD